MLYRNFATEAEINAEYDPAVISDRDAAIERFTQLSATASAAMPEWFSRQFGATDAEYVDIFPCGVAGAPVHIFVHGGYWRALSARQFAFVAQKLVDQGVTVVLTNYGLCPDIPIGDIVDQTREAIAWVARHAEQLAVDTERLTLSGHSAGGHLAAMMLSTDWTRYGLAPDLIKGVIALSGLFDLAPFRHSWLQESLNLTEAEVAAYSPICLPIHGSAPVVLRFGGIEQSEFARQSKSYAEYLRAAGLEVDCQAIEGADHFTVLDPFLADDGEFIQLIKRYSQ